MNTVAAKIRPILMHKRSIQNILADRKTQTRRIIKPQPEYEGVKAYGDSWAWRKGKDWFSGVTTEQLVGLFGLCFAGRCPYGNPGDQLWVKEAWLPRNRGTLYKADFDDVEAAGIAGMYSENAAWKSSLFMPRWASRLVLEITKIRVERIQNISKKDVVAEGFLEWQLDGPYVFPSLWDDTNGKGAWDRNDWVWVVEFRRIRE